MNKYITDTFKNNLKSIIKDCTIPQQKAVKEVTRGIITEGTPILRHLVQDEEKTAKKQAEKYSHHLYNVDLTEAIEKLALRHAKANMRKYTIVAYDLSDISKECAKKMEKLRYVFDGSKRKTSKGYTFHGVGINNMLIKTEIHDGDKDFLPQIRKKIVTNLFRELDNQGILVADRGNDSKEFFHFLRSDLKVNFIVRLKDNRSYELVKTGDKVKAYSMPLGQYDVYLMNSHGNVERKHIYRLIIQKHLGEKEPIRLLTTLLKKRFSKNQIVTMYLERWGVESSFKRIKGKFNLEKIRVLKYQVFKNLVALTMFAMIISTLIFQRIQKMNHMLIAGILLVYKQFIRRKSLSFNLDSFISFIQSTIPRLSLRNHDPPNQLLLF